MEAEKLAQEKTEIQRQYIMVCLGYIFCCSYCCVCTELDNDHIYILQYYEMSYGLNVEMHKQVIINEKRLSLYN